MKGDEPHSLIFVLDNLREKNKKLYKSNHQRVRSKEEIENLFKKAKLSIFDQTKETTLLQGDVPVKIWALK